MTYRRLEAPLTADDSGFADAARAFFAAGGAGMNVTAPFKEVAFRLASSVSERSRLAVAANTLTADGDGWRADNTDGIGLVRDLTSRLGLPLTGQRLLILGAGGASAGILGPLLDARPARIVLWNRSVDKAQGLVRRFAAAYPGAKLSAVSQIPFPTARASEDAPDQETPFDLAIHATSFKAAPPHSPTPPLKREPGLAEGEAKGNAPTPWLWLDRLCASDTFFYDLSYADNEETPFLRWARTWGARRWSDGFGMLVEQAAESFRIWHGCLPETTSVFAALRPKSDR